MTIIFRPSGGTGLYSIIYNIAQGTELGDSHKAVVSKSRSYSPKPKRPRGINGFFPNSHHQYVSGSIFLCFSLMSWKSLSYKTDIILPCYVKSLYLCLILLYMVFNQRKYLNLLKITVSTLNVSHHLLNKKYCVPLNWPAVPQCISSEIKSKMDMWSVVPSSLTLWCFCNVTESSVVIITDMRLFSILF